MCNITLKVLSNGGTSMENQKTQLKNKRSIDIVVTHNESSPRKKRKSNLPLICEDYIGMDELPWGEFHEDLLERILAWLPVSSFFRFRSVCKRWNSILESPSFLRACAEVPSRGPWFYMVDSKFEQGIVYDTEVNNWHHIRLPHVLSKNLSKPIAAAGGLICFELVYGKFFICNLLTDNCRELPHLQTTETIHAITMVACNNSYKVFVIYGNFPNLVVKVYDASTNRWSEPSVCCNMKERCEKSYLKQNTTSDDGIFYFLNRGCYIVSSDVRRSPSKEYSSVLSSTNSGEETVYFFNRGGNVVACNIQKGLWREFPPLLHSPNDFLNSSNEYLNSSNEYSLDIVNCGGRILVVVLRDFLASSELGIWEFNNTDCDWKQAAAMPVHMSHQYFGKKADINCTAYNNEIMICISSSEFSSIVLCKFMENIWLELPPCDLPGSSDAKKFVSAFPFEPRLEASV